MVGELVGWFSIEEERSQNLGGMDFFFVRFEHRLNLVTRTNVAERVRTRAQCEEKISRVFA